MNFYSFTSYFERLKFDSFRTEDDMNAVDYTEVDFSHYRATNSAPCGNAICLYFVPRYMPALPTTPQMLHLLICPKTSVVMLLMKARWLTDEQNPYNSIFFCL